MINNFLDKIYDSKKTRNVDFALIHYYLIIVKFKEEKLFSNLVKSASNHNWQSLLSSLFKFCEKYYKDVKQNYLLFISLVLSIEDYLEDLTSIN